MARKLRTKPGRAVYARRKAIVEPVFGQIDTCQGGKALSLRGLEGADAEWHLLVACHNLRKLFASEAQQPSPAAEAEHPALGLKSPNDPTAPAKSGAEAIIDRRSADARDRYRPKLLGGGGRPQSVPSARRRRTRDPHLGQKKVPGTVRDVPDNSLSCIVAGCSSV